jgi:tripartite-type tricarboxylate transporter receptor subunit TctC
MSVRAETASFGGKTIKIIVGMPPGGGVDSYARLVQRHLGRFLPGSPGIVVQNMPGAGSLRSVMALVNSPEDVVGTFSSSLLTEAISMPERVKIDFRNFASIGNVSEDIRVCYTRSALGVHGWSDLLAREQVVFRGHRARHVRKCRHCNAAQPVRRQAQAGARLCRQR